MICFEEARHSWGTRRRCDLGDEGDDSLGGGYGTNDSLLGETGVDFLDGGPGTNDQCDSGPPPGDGNDSEGCEVGPG